jgi:hypothetical protein
MGGGEDAVSPAGVGDGIFLAQWNDSALKNY